MGKIILGETELTQASEVSALNGRVSTIESIIPLGKTINKTWSQLKAMRDGSTLVPGQWYRITDYECTTTQTDTQSAGHAFDVVVFSTDVNKLNENAYAVQHQGDTYFANSKLDAWELKYCLDNDTSRFAWADTTNGKGVIYRMVDEFNNDVPYDFKNIQFKRWKVTDSKGRSSINNKYMSSITSELPSGLTVPDASDFIWAYTFSSSSNGGEQTDKSLTKGSLTYVNVIKAKTREFNKKLSNNVFFGTGCRLNTLEGESYNNTIGYGSYFNIFNNCMYNMFGEFCISNTFGNGCNFNTFGANCANNIFGISCGYNTFDDGCGSNTFGNDCKSNVFGKSCDHNTFGNYCQNITFSKDYSEYNIIENGNQYITLTSTQTTSDSDILCNIKICQGVNNTTTTKTVSHNTVNDTFQTEYKPANSQVISV